jgi:phosphate-selective porin OprO/OprP
MALNNFIKAACLSTCLGLASGSILANTNVETNGGLNVYDSENSDHWFNLSGKMQMDQHLYHVGLQNIDSSFDLRSVQATVKGGMGQDLSYSFRLKRGRGGNKAVSMDNARVSYSGFNSWSRVTVGQVDLPYGFSSNSFAENGFDSVFGPSSNNGSFGFGLTAWNDNFGLSYAVQQHDSGVFRSAGTLDSAARVSFAPLMRDNLVVHLGASAYYVNNSTADHHHFGNDANLDDHGTNFDFTLVDNGNEGVQRGFGIDAAMLRGPLFLQAQAHQVTYLNGDNSSNPAMGWSVEGSYAVTGETRDYNRINGSFSGLRTSGDSSSWQVSARTSGVRQHDGALNNMVGASVAWTVNNNLTLLANYDNHLDTNAGALSLRLQAAW